MAFHNEKISEHDKEWVGKLVNYDTISKIARWVHKFRSPEWIWAADRERNAFLIDLGGGVSNGSGLAYAVLLLDGKVILFNFARKGTGDETVGRHTVFEVHKLTVPPDVTQSLDEIQQMIREGLDEYNRCKSFADGGTVANPNMVARSNVKSFDVVFK